MPVSEAVAWLERGYDDWQYVDLGIEDGVHYYAYWPRFMHGAHSHGHMFEFKGDNGPWMQSYTYKRGDE